MTHKEGEREISADVGASDCNSCSTHNRPGLQGTSGSFFHPLSTSKFKMFKSWPKDIPWSTQLSDLVENGAKNPRHSHQFSALSETWLDHVLLWGGTEQDMGPIFASLDTHRALAHAHYLLRVFSMNECCIILPMNPDSLAKLIN